MKAEQERRRRKKEEEGEEATSKSLASSVGRLVWRPALRSAISTEVALSRDWRICLGCMYKQALFTSARNSSCQCVCVCVCHHLLARTRREAERHQMSSSSASADERRFVCTAAAVAFEPSKSAVDACGARKLGTHKAAVQSAYLT